MNAGVAMTSIDAYLFSAFSDLICHLKDTGISGFFFGYTVLPDSEEAELGSSNQEASPSASKNTGVALVLLCS